MNFMKCTDSDCMLCNPDSERMIGVRNHAIGKLRVGDLIADVEVTEYGYSVTILENEAVAYGCSVIEVETYHAGNNRLDSSPGQSLACDHPLAAPFETLKQYASQTASEMLAEHTAEAID